MDTTPRQESKLLIDETPFQVLPTLATQIGLNEAIFMQQLHWMLKYKTGKVVDGVKWVYSTQDEWMEMFPFWGRSTILRLIAKLVEAEIVLEANLNDELSRRKWYTIDYVRLDGAILRKEKKQRTDYPNFGQWANSRKRMSQLETIHRPNLGQSIVSSLDIDLTKTPSKIPNADSLSGDLDGTLSSNDLPQEAPLVPQGAPAAELETSPEEPEPAPSENLPDPTPPVAADPPLPDLDKPYIRIYSSAHGALVHIAKSATGRVLCGESVRHRESPTAPIGQHLPCEKCQTAYDNRPGQQPTTLKPPKDMPLKLAVGHHVQRFPEGEVNEYTGVLAQAIATVWRERLNTDTLSEDQYAAIARSIPIFVDWYHKECGEDTHLPEGATKLQNWYRRFPKDGTAKAPQQELVEHPDNPGEMITRRRFEIIMAEKEAVRNLYGKAS